MARGRRPDWDTPKYLRKDLIKDLHYLIEPDAPLYDQAKGLCPSCTKIIRVIFDTIRDALLRGEEVHIHGFGKFYMKAHPTRRYRNLVIEPAFQGIRTQEVIEIPPTSFAKFKPSKLLKALMNKDQPEKSWTDEWHLARGTGRM